MDRPTPTAMDARLLTEPEAAAYLGIKAETLRKWRWLRRAPPFARVGRLVRYRRADLDRFVAGRIAEAG